MRLDQRSETDLRALSIERGFSKYAEGSCLITLGNTKVVCTASIEEKVPPFLLEKNSGWITAEYGMLPRSTLTRTMREVTKGFPTGRTQEIQRLVGRSLRAVVNLESLGQRTIWMDCDVIQADGGTRTASITGAFVALVEALNHLRHRGVFLKLPLKDFVAATSVGIVGGKTLLDLTYEEDSKAQVDMNVVMTAAGQLVEVQGTAEGGTFSEKQLADLISFAKTGIGRLIEFQKQTLKDILTP